jgi:ketopantoate reductase
MDINRIAILGAGAVGASLAHQLLKENPSQNITIIAEGPRSERYRREGLTVNEDVIRPGVSDGEPHDLVFLATKSYHLDQGPAPSGSMCRSGHPHHESPERHRQ